MDAKFVAKVMQYIVQYYAHSRVKRLNKLNIQTLILSAHNLALSPTNHQLYHVYTKKNCAIEKSEKVESIFMPKMSTINQFSKWMCKTIFMLN